MLCDNFFRSSTFATYTNSLISPDRVLWLPALGDHSKVGAASLHLLQVLNDIWWMMMVVWMLMLDLKIFFLEPIRGG